MTSGKSIALRAMAQSARESILSMVYHSKCSHVGSALSCVDIITVLYADVLTHNSKNPVDPRRDRFILSKGHACTALYAVLAEQGYFEKTLLSTYAMDDSLLMSHVSSKVPGVEFSTGSLGHGLPVATGIALAGKKKNSDYSVFVLMSDGELNEGSNFEAIMLSAQLKLDNLVAIIDCNKLQAMGHTANIINLEPIEDKFRIFGWDVIRMDGHSHEQLSGCLSKFKKNREGRPKVLIADTIKGKGVSYMEDKLEWHYRSPNSQDFDVAIHEIKGAQ